MKNKQYAEYWGQTRRIMGDVQNGKQLYFKNKNKTKQNKI